MAATLSTRLKPSKNHNLWTWLMLVVFGLLSIGCRSDYSNKKEYTIKQGELVKIYYTNNSCCEVCWNSNSLAHVKQIKKDFIEETEGDCAGCTVHYSSTFEGISIGTDTLKFQQHAQSKGCDLTASNVTKIIVHVIN